MATATRKSSNGYTRRDWNDFAHTGPGTLAGKYLRMFWQPVYHSEDLPAGWAKPIRIMGEDFTLFRGKSGKPYLLDFRCAHRGMQLSPGWVEGERIRCFYHGWMYDGSGQCVEQPAEPEPFCEKVRLRACPALDYLGLVFAYLGDGEPPPLPRYPHFENFEGLFEIDSYPRACNYYNNLENGGDIAHVGFVHRGMEGSFDGITDSPIIRAEEDEWGVVVYSRRKSGGPTRKAHYGMPNMSHINALPNDTQTAAFREFLAWWVPVDDENHIQFTVYAVRVSPDKAEEYSARRDARLAKRTIPKEVLAAEILAGKMRLQDVDPETTDLVRLQDDVAQIGQGVIPNRRADRLGRSDASVLMRRTLWARELRALAEGQPLKQWVFDLEKQHVEGRT